MPVSIQSYQSLCKQIGFFVVFDYIISLIIGNFDSLILLLVALVKIVLLVYIIRSKSYRIAGSVVSWQILLSLLLLLILNFLIAALFNSRVDLLFSPASSVFQTFILLMMMIATVLAEELMYRAWLLKALKELGRSRVTAMLIAGFLFSLGHIYLGIGGWIFALCSAFILSWLYYHSGGIQSGILVHLAYNLIILKIKGYW